MFKSQTGYTLPLQSNDGCASLHGLQEGEKNVSNLWLQVVSLASCFARCLVPLQTTSYIVSYSSSNMQENTYLRVVCSAAFQEWKAHFASCLDLATMYTVVPRLQQ